MEFIKGKWYKMNVGDDCYAKFDKFSNSGIWTASEHIYNKKIKPCWKFWRRAYL